MNNILKKIRQIKNTGYMVIPNDPNSELKNFTVTPGKIALMLGLYTFAVMFLVVVIIAVSPVRGIFSDAQITSAQTSQMKELNERLLYLARDLESISSLNKKLQRAIQLGDSHLLDSIKNSTDTTSQKGTEYFGGNILEAFNLLFQKEEPAPKKAARNVYFLKPVSYGFVSRDYNAKIGHMGIDYVVKTGTPVLASSSGYVSFADYTADDGYMIMITHDAGYVSVYKHCSVLNKKVRDTVLQGETVALSGNTGKITTGPHLHFEIWRDGQVIDPKTVIINYGE